MTEDEMRNLRLLIREETNAAVYASEERIGNHFKQLGERMENRFGQLEGRMGRFEERLDRLEGDQRDIRVSIVKLETNLSESISFSMM